MADRFDRTFQGFFDIGSGKTQAAGKHEGHQYLTLVYPSNQITQQDPQDNQMIKDNHPYVRVKHLLDNATNGVGRCMYVCIKAETVTNHPKWFNQRLANVESTTPTLDGNQIAFAYRSIKCLFAILYGKGHNIVSGQAVNNNTNPLSLLVAGALFMIRVHGAYEDCIKMRLEDWVQTTSLFTVIDSATLGIIQLEFSRIGRDKQKRCFAKDMMKFTSCVDILMCCTHETLVAVPVFLASLLRLTTLAHKLHEDAGHNYKDPNAKIGYDHQQSAIIHRLLALTGK